MFAFANPVSYYNIFFAEVEVSFDQTSYTVVENSTTPTRVCILLNGALERSVQVNVNFVDINTTADDHSNTEIILSFDSQSENPQCFELSINSDDVFENTEVFSIQLSTLDDVINIPNDIAEVIISDSSLITIGFTNETLPASEGEMVRVCVAVFGGSLSELVTLSLTVIPPLERQGIVRKSVLVKDRSMVTTINFDEFSMELLREYNLAESSSSGWVIIVIQGYGLWNISGEDFMGSWRGREGGEEREKGAIASLIREKLGERRDIVTEVGGGTLSLPSQ